MIQPQSADVIPIGTVLDGAYRLTRLLGQGGMGAVYEATHTGAGKRVAVKIMHRGLMAYPELRARFQREAKVTMEIANPHVVRVFGFGTAPSGEPYLVMEFLEGEDLQTHMERVGPLPLKTVVQIVNQVASALTEAHTAGVVHRDLKPDNVFLVHAPDGSLVVKVVDFGISKVLKASATKLTVARAVFGSPEYMAPEQAEGRQDLIDHRSDQWSLACLAWVAMTFCLPFSGPDANATLNQVMAGVPTPPKPGAPRIPPEIDQVLRKALSKQSSQRYPTIRAFARMFEAAAVEVERQAAPAAPAFERPAAAMASSPSRRSPVLALVAAALIALGGATWLLRSQPPVSGWLQAARSLLDHR